MRINRVVAILSIFIITAAGTVVACKPLASPVSVNTAKKSTTSVAAASDLKPALDKIKARYEGVTGQKIEVTYGSSGLLARQVEQGAPIDIFISAATNYIDELENKKLLRARDRTTLAFGRLALVFGAGSKGKSMANLADKNIERIAIANPQHAPYGVAAKDALMNLKLWPRVESKIVFGDSVAQAYQYLDSGDVDAAIIALSYAIDNNLKYKIIDDGLHRPLAITAAIVSRDNEVGVAPFLTYLKSEEARQVMLDYGYEVPRAKSK